MNVYLEFGLSMAWAQMVAVILWHLVWHDMSLAMIFISGLMGGVVGWLFGATLADHLDWLMAMSHGYRLFAIGGIVVLFVGGFQRALSREVE